MIVYNPIKKHPLGCFNVCCHTVYFRSRYLPITGKSFASPLIALMTPIMNNTRRITLSTGRSKIPTIDTVRIALPSKETISNSSP